MTTLTVTRVASRGALDEALAEGLQRAIAAPGPSALMLSGGSTPLRAYRALAGRRLPHDRGLHILFSDDRYVPCYSQASNYHRSRPLLDALALPPARVLRVRTDCARDRRDGLREAASDASGLRRAYRLGLLGLGANGHTASLFSEADLARASGRLAIAVQRPDGMSAVSVTPGWLHQVAQPLFVVESSGKEDALRALLARDPALIAWHALQDCQDVELWMASAPV